jgi:hypothetical protein
MHYKKLILAGILQLLALPTIVTAQTYNRVFEYKKGDVFQSEVITTSNSMIKRGKQILNVSSTNNIVKSHTIKEADNQGYKLAVKIDKMNASIDANKVRTSFNSEKTNDTTSNILKGLYFVVNKPIEITINKNGVIQNFEEYKLEMASDTLVSFAGIQPEIFKKSSLINFFADFTYYKNLKKGYSWSDSLTVGDEKTNTRFLIDYVDEKVTILNFFKTSTTSMLNTNSNGTYVIDNTTGLILEKYVYVIAVGFQLSAGKTMYAVSRTTSIVEKTKKITN